MEKSKNWKTKKFWKNQKHSKNIGKNKKDGEKILKNFKKTKIFLEIIQKIGKSKTWR